MIAADSKTRHSYKFGPKVPLRNPDPRPCAVCGTLFWHHSFHRHALSNQDRQAKTCGKGCKYILMKRNNPPEWKARYYGKTGE